MSIQTVRDVARRNVVTDHPDATAQKLAVRMREEDVGSVVIVTDEKPVGIVTDRDLTVEVLAHEDPRLSSRARELMSGFPTTITDDEGVAAATRTMDDHDIRRLPVVDHGGRLVGIVTLDDIYRELVAEHEHIADVIATESPD